MNGGEILLRVRRFGAQVLDVHIAHPFAFNNDDIHSGHFAALAGFVPCAEDG